MNPVAHYKPSKTSNPDCPDLIRMAERELSAFFNAVSQLFGREQAEISAANWLQELIETDALPASAREWRLITARVLTEKVVAAKVSTRLSSRVNTSSLSAEPQIA
jgi:hypothetical protein